MHVDRSGFTKFKLLFDLETLSRSRMNVKKSVNNVYAQFPRTSDI